MTANIPNLEIIFVQLGQKNYGHLFSNMELVHRMFPHTVINCIISKESVLIRKMPPFAKVYIYDSSLKINEIFQSKSIDPNFRKGFWRYSLERLIAIESFHAQNRKLALLHIESDILLLPGFPLNSFLKLKQIFWLPVNPECDVASLVFFPNYDLTKEFSKDLLNYMASANNPTDMEALSILRSRFPSKYKLLPISHSSLPKLNNIKKEFNFESTLDLDGVFDASKIGMWLTGIDPRNDYGFLELFATKKLLVDNSFIDPSAYAIKFTESDGLYFESGKQKINIYNLHIHSKSRKIFSTNWSKEISYLTSLSRKNKKITKFYPVILVSLILENFAKGTFLEFLYNSPMMRLARRAKLNLKSLNKI